MSETIAVEARLEADGSVTPVRVTWRGRQQAVSDVGRAWVETRDSVPYRHVLVMLPNGDRLELALNQHTLAWELVQSWTTPTTG
ncbi:MAG: hypothetical protein U0822_13255 [Anaerolineae bacterium]